MLFSFLICSVFLPVLHAVQTCMQMHVEMLLYS